MSAVLNEYSPLIPEMPAADLGSIAIRVVVLPHKDKKQITTEEGPDEPLDLDADEDLGDSKKSPLASYLESSKGKQCCVFLVNGQRQDALDNSFIFQELGYKYLRNRMMIIVDVDGLTQPAIGSLMQGSRQGFYRGEVWSAIIKRVKATLKGDPELQHLEEQAEEEVSELETGDEKVRHTLDQLIDAHHEHGPNESIGPGVQATGDSDGLGFKLVTKDGVVFLTTPDKGAPADYPVLVSRPAGLVRLRPNEVRTIVVKSLPSNAWVARSDVQVDLPKELPELSHEATVLADHMNLSLRFSEKSDQDADHYPIAAVIGVNARFNGIKESRRLELKLVIQPESTKPPPVLLDEPTFLKVNSRVPIKITAGDIDTHVRLSWNGKDDLVSAPPYPWHFEGLQTAGVDKSPGLNFSHPNAGRFTLLIAANPVWSAGDSLTFKVAAVGPGGKRLVCDFPAVVVEKTQPPEKQKKEPRSIENDVPSGATRRPPYQLVYIKKPKWQEVECWSGRSWSGQDPGCFVEPTDKKPLTLIINNDMESLQEYRKFIQKEYKESEIERRVTKYTSHVAFHLYQMYLNLVERRKSGTPAEGDIDQAHSDEIRRVANTLLQLMKVSR